MLSRTKKDLTPTETVFEPLFESLMNIASKHSVSHLSLMFLLRIKAYQTFNNRFIQGLDVYKLFTNEMKAYQIYLAELVNNGWIEYVHAGSHKLSGYNVTPKGERVCASITRLYNNYSKQYIRAHQDTRINTKPFKQDQFSDYFSKVKNPNAHLKNKPIEHLKDKLPPKGYKLAKRQERAKEREAEDLKEHNNIRAENPNEDQPTIKKSSNPFDL